MNVTYVQHECSVSNHECSGAMSSKQSSKCQCAWMSCYKILQALIMSFSSLISNCVILMTPSDCYCLLSNFPDITRDQHGNQWTSLFNN